MYGIYLSARDHLEQASAILSRGGPDTIELRNVLNYTLLIVDQMCELSRNEHNVIELNSFRRMRDGE